MHIRPEVARFASASETLLIPDLVLELTADERALIVYYLKELAATYAPKLPDAPVA